MNEPLYCVYILTNKNHSVFYTGRTNYLEQRINEHKQKLVKGFTKKYNVTKLVYYECGGDFDSSLKREKQIKKYLKSWKINLINSKNPQWNDLSKEW